jgi:hypothetical protein
MFQRYVLQKQITVITRTKCRSNGNAYIPKVWSRIVGTSNGTIGHSYQSFSTTVLTDAEQEFRKDGILDERGLVQFDTLHNMQVRSCRVYADKDLFATFSPTTQNFEWMTFAECMSIFIALLFYIYS